jgi:hypothetical protein
MRLPIGFLVVLLVPLAYTKEKPAPPQVHFARPVVFRTAGNDPSGIAAGDFNNDGIPDLLVGDSGGGMSFVALGKGDGTFGDWLGGCASGDGGGDPAFVAVGKFGGPLLDALGNGEQGYAFMCEGDGNGHFSGRWTFAFDPNEYAVGFATADFNRDGNLDVALIGQEGELIVYLEGAEGDTFWPAHTLYAMTTPVFIAAGDFNGDDNPDIVVLTSDYSDSGGYVGVLLGDGKGGFGSPLLFRIPENDLGYSRPSALAVGDFNGDGKLDVAVAISNWTSNDTSYVAILLGNGDGTFRKGQIAPAGPNPQSVAAADFNGDGILDLVVGNVPCGEGCGSPGSISVLLGNGDGTFQPPQTFAAGGAWPQVVVADFNGDGKPDVATANGDSSSVSVLLNITPAPRGAGK